jgi:flagellar basal-body rod protein FlgB
VFSGIFRRGITVAQQREGHHRMIDALFNQTNYVAAKKGLDVIALRQEAIAGNIANLETPGYQRLDVAPSFNTELERACASGDARSIAALRPTLAPDATAVALGPDGNTVNLESELLQSNKNYLAHTLETQLVTGSLLRLKLAITGKGP